MMRAVVQLRVAALAILALTSPAHADCALMGLTPKVLTPADALVADDGGIVVGALSEDRGSLESGDIAVQKEWRFVVPKGTIEPTIVTLAPGLAVYRASTDALDLQNAKGESLGTAKRTGGKRDKVAAPKIKSIKYEAPVSRRSIQRVEVLIDGDAPAGAIALVLADAKGTPKSWTRVAGKVFYPYEHRDCMTLPNGSNPSKKGDKVTLFWVDDSGRKSAFTKPMTIK